MPFLRGIKNFESRKLECRIPTTEVGRENIFVLVLTVF